MPFTLLFRNTNPLATCIFVQDLAVFLDYEVYIDESDVTRWELDPPLVAYLLEAIASKCSGLLSLALAEDAADIFTWPHGNAVADGVSRLSQLTALALHSGRLSALSPQMALMTALRQLSLCTDSRHARHELSALPNLHTLQVSDHQPHTDVRRSGGACAANLPATELGVCAAAWASTKGADTCMELSKMSAAVCSLPRVCCLGRTRCPTASRSWWCCQQRISFCALMHLFPMMA